MTHPPYPTLRRSPVPLLEEYHLTYLASLAWVGSLFQPGRALPCFLARPSPSSKSSIPNGHGPSALTWWDAILCVQLTLMCVSVSLNTLWAFLCKMKFLQTQQRRQLSRRERPSKSLLSLQAKSAILYWTLGQPKLLGSTADETVWDLILFHVSGRLAAGPNFSLYILMGLASFPGFSLVRLIQHRAFSACAIFQGGGNAWLLPLCVPSDLPKSKLSKMGVWTWTSLLFRNTLKLVHGNIWTCLPRWNST